MTTEHDIQSSAMLAVQQEWPESLVLRQNTGAATDRAGNFVRFGTPGQADLRVILYGLAIELEVKTEAGRQSKSQINYEKAYTRAGGIYIVIRDHEKAVEQIKCRISKHSFSKLFNLLVSLGHRLKLF